mgnify:CR=1 FL=1
MKLFGGIILLIGVLLSFERTIVINDSPALAGEHVSSSVPFLEAQKSPVMENIEKKGTEEVWAIVTAYSSDVWQNDNDPFTTASGEQVREGVIACPREIPFWTKVEIEGKEYTCLDRMSLANNGKYDIWFPNRKLAYEWGVKKVNVKIFE